MLIRILLHPDSDARLLEQVAGILESAAESHAAHFVKVEDRPTIEDHYGYYTDMLSSTVLGKEYGTRFYRLTIRPGEHPVFDNLAALIIDHINAR